MVRKILKIGPPPIPRGDKILWIGSRAEMFSVKGAYWVDQRRRFKSREEIWKRLLKRKIHVCLKTLFWRIATNSLNTLDKLHNGRIVGRRLLYNVRT